ncbi:MAG: AsmA family protein [Gemmatimonadota bacterium]
MASGFRRPVARVFVGVTVALVLVCSAVAIALEVIVDADDLAAWVAPRASAALNRPVTVGEASLVLLPWPGARISDVRVENQAGFAEHPLAQANHLWIDVAVLPLFFGRVRVRGIRARGMHLRLAIDEDGTSNFGDLVPEPREVAEDLDSPVRLALRKLGVSDATVTYTDAHEPRELTLTGAVMDATLSSDGSGGWRMRADAGVDSLLMRWPDETRDPVRTEGPTASWALYGDNVFDRIQIGDGLVAHAGETLMAQGRLTGLRGPSPALELTLSNDALRASALEPWLPGALRAALEARSASDTTTFALDGTVAVRLHLLAPDPQAARPIVRGEIGLGGVGLQIGPHRVGEDLTGSIEFEPDTLTLDAISGTVAGGLFELYGQVTGPDRTLRLEVLARPDLAALDHLGWTPGSAAFSGRVALDVALTGSLLDLNGIGASGRAMIEGLRADHPRFGMPLYVPVGEVSLEGREATWTDLAVMAGVERLETTGSLRGFDIPFLSTAPRAEPGNARTPGAPPIVEASINGLRLDLDALLGRSAERSDETYARVAFAHLGQRDAAPVERGGIPQRAAFSRPTALPVHGSFTLSFDSLSLRPWVLDDVSALLVLTDSTLSVLDASFGAWGGRAQGEVRLGVGTRAAEPFTLGLALEEVAATPFFATLTPVGAAVSGTLDLDLDLTGSLNRSLLPTHEDLTGEGAFTIDEGRVAGTGMNLAVADFLSAESWSDVPFDRWTATFSIHDSMLELHRSELGGALGQATLSGLIALEGALDLALGLTIPPAELEHVSLRRTGVGPEMLSQLEAAGRPLELGLRASGSVAGPTLEPDASVAVTRAPP